MNPKIDKLARDIEKTEKKIADLQKKLELFKEEKTRLENEDYGDIAYQSVIKEKDLLTNCLKQMSRDSSAVLRLIRKKGVRTPEAKVHKKTLDELKREASNIPIVDKTADLFSGLIVDVLESKQ